MSIKRISKSQAIDYINKIGIIGIALDGFLYANPNADNLYSNDELDGLLIFDGDFTLLHSRNENFLSEAYDFVGETAFFNCVDYDTSKFLHEKKGAFINSYCHIYGYLKDMPTENSFPAPTGMTVKNIDLKDLDYINDYYTYKSPKSKERLRHEIVSRESSALYDGEKILAWNLLHNDYAMGVMFVPPEHRGKGYAQVVAFELLKKIVAKGKIPYVQIVDGNTPSICLAEKLGFEFIFDACWLSKQERKK